MATTRRHRTRPTGSRIRRLAGGVAALVAILAMLVGVPYALYALAGNPLPDHVPDWSHLGELLTTRDDGSLFLGAITWVGWIGWASFALPLLVEIPFQLARRRPPRILGLAWQQRRAAALVAAALSIGATPAVASASAVTIAPAPAVAAPSQTWTPPQEGRHAIYDMLAGPAPAATTAAPANGEPIYEVARRDWLYYIAERFLGNGDRYPQIAALNPNLERADPRFPDHIEPGQRVRLPADARDRGARPHATGTLHLPVPAPASPGSPGTAPAPPTTAPSTPAPSTEPTASPTPTPSPTATASASPQAQPSQQPPTAQASSDAGQQTDSDSDDNGLDAVLPITAAMATAGMLAALLLFRLIQRRRRQRRYRRPGRRIPQTPNPGIERQVRAAAQPVDVNRLDHALRAMAAGLRDRDPAGLPDIAAAWLSRGEVHVMLTQPNADPPPPFEADDKAMTWTLPATAGLPDVDEILAPLPALVTVASKPGGDHLLIDLERAGLLGIGGDPERTADLMRYLAAELATSQWSDDVEIILAGFDSLDAENLIAIGGDRVTAATSPAAAIVRARRRAAANVAAIADSDITSTFAGRVGDIVADAWMPHVLLIADIGDADEHLRGLETELRLAGRCAVAAAVITSAPTTWRIDITSDGTLAIDWLTDAHGHLLDPDEEARELDLAGAEQDNQPAHGDPVATGPADTTSPEQERGPAVPEPIRRAPVPAEPVTATQPVDVAAFDPIATGKPRPMTPTSPRRRRAPHDPDLDADIDAWYRPDPHRPRIAVLGPVHVEAPGEAPDERVRFYSELVVYLAQRGRVGATGEQIDDAVWPERGVNARSRRVAISKVRRWLGENADGQQWLPFNVGSDRKYRLIPGVLLDWHLFRRLRTRGEARGAAGAADLRRALELVRGEPLAGAELPYSSGYRNPYTWLPGSDIQPHNLASAVVDTAHQLVDLYLAAADTVGARWAVERAWLADPARLDDHPWIDAMRVARADGRAAELRALLDDLVRTREVEVPEDLSTDTYAAIHELLGDLLRVG